jgi:hypothetical protein
MLSEGGLAGYCIKHMRVKIPCKYFCYKYRVTSTNSRKFLILSRRERLADSLGSTLKMGRVKMWCGNFVGRHICCRLSITPYCNSSGACLEPDGFDHSLNAFLQGLSSYIRFPRPGRIQTLQRISRKVKFTFWHSTHAGIFFIYSKPQLCH